MTELTLWMGTVGQADFARRVAAAAACGYAAVSVLPSDCLDMDPERLRAMAEAEGVRLLALDPVTTWLPGWSPARGWTDIPERIAFAESFAAWEVDVTLRTAAALGCRSVSLIEPYGRPVPLDRGAEAFASVCDRAADYGIQVALEAMPFSGIPDLATAWSIVVTAGPDNGGHVQDNTALIRGGAHKDHRATKT
ncbi:sugar phosphate isomerase/epimerase family protein, partial [Streptomyces spiralis]|uniref:sugar phosphate isomerase/epimerase family protein n=1 Tax=Streptomyces spiralis TaxID=66376 RepID=UPI0033C70343